MGKKHSTARQPKSAAGRVEKSRINKRSQRLRVTFEDVDSIPSFDGVRVDPLVQAQPGEERVLNALVDSHSPDLETWRHPSSQAIEVLLGTGDILPPNPA